MKPHNIKTLWTKDLPEGSKEGFVLALRNDNTILPKLSKIIDSLVESNCRFERSKEAYDTPNWPYLQAHINGYMQAMKQIKDLINVGAI